MQPTIIPMLSFEDAAAAIDFYKIAFDASEVSRITDTDGKIGHAELSVYGASIMLADERSDINILSAQTLGGTPVMLLLEVIDADLVFNQAVAAGAMIDRPLADMEYKMGSCGELVDPFGYKWMIMSGK